MKRKLSVFLILLVLSVLVTTIAFAAAPPPVTNLKAVGKMNVVTITWSPSAGAEGYILYRKVGNENFKYRYITSRTDFNDQTAHHQLFNFYRVYPYKTVGGKKVLGPSDKYVYARSINFPSVKNIKAKGEIGGVLLTWSPDFLYAQGYIIYRKIGNTGNFTYRMLVNNPTQAYKDTTASSTELNFYRIYPYMMRNGKRILGPSDTYVYAKALKQTYNANVTGLKLTSGVGHNTISWNNLAGAQGYIIYRGNRSPSASSSTPVSFSYLSTTSSTEYNDFNVKAEFDYDQHIFTYDYYFYRIYPYKVVNGKTLVGKSNSYVFGKPQIFAGMIYDLEAFCPKGEQGKMFVRWKPVPGASGYQYTYEEKTTTTAPAYTTGTTLVRSGLDPNFIYKVTVIPYKLVKGRKVLSVHDYEGFSLVRPKSDSVKLYSGKYVVGKNIPARTYKVYPDKKDSTYNAVFYVLHPNGYFKQAERLYFDPSEGNTEGLITDLKPGENIRLSNCYMVPR